MAMKLYVKKMGKKYQTEFGTTANINYALVMGKNDWMFGGKPPEGLIEVERIIREVPTAPKVPAKRGKPKKAK